MYDKRIRNTVLAVIAALLLLNIGVMLSAQPASRTPASRTQYRVVVLRVNNTSNPEVLQAELNQQSAEGWQYVGDASGALIFKK
jgi:hypothetical protein